MQVQLYTATGYPRGYVFGNQMMFCATSDEHAITLATEILQQHGCCCCPHLVVRAIPENVS